MSVSPKSVGMKTCTDVILVRSFYMPVICHILDFVLNAYHFSWHCSENRQLIYNVNGLLQYFYLKNF